MTDSTTPYDYRVSALKRAVDGDTFDLTLEKRVDYGFYLIDTKTWSMRFRLLDVDTWETNEAGGSAATKAADAWLKAAIFDDVLRGRSEKTDHFGRWLIDLYRTDSGEHMEDYLRANGHEKARAVAAR